MNESEAHKVWLNQVIRTMYQTGLDMQSRCEETGLAGLALNIIECLEQRINLRMLPTFFVQSDSRKNQK